MYNPWYVIAWRLLWFPLYMATRLAFVLSVAVLTLDRRDIVRAWKEIC